MDFNPRSPDGERPLLQSVRLEEWKFQSTLPGWGATGETHTTHKGGDNFNPRSPDGERPLFFVIKSLKSRFQSTLPGWGATRRWFAASRQVDISIHAPRMGSDRPDRATTPGAWHFNPRSPDGERPLFAVLGYSLFRISIHAPRMGSDRSTA